MKWTMDAYYGRAILKDGLANAVLERRIGDLATSVWHESQAIHDAEVETTKKRESIGKIVTSAPSGEIVIWVRNPITGEWSRS